MTDREAMQQALEALEQSVGTCFDQYSHHEVMSRPEHFMNRAMEALRERLAQPEHDDPIGDAQAKLIAEQATTRDYRTRYDRGCYKCGSHYCPADCPEPAHLVRQQSQQEPVAWVWKDGTITADPDRADGTWNPLYTTPPQRKPEQEPVCAHGIGKTKCSFCH